MFITLFLKPTLIRFKTYNLFKSGMTFYFKFSLNGKSTTWFCLKTLLDCFQEGLI